MRRFPTWLVVSVVALAACAGAAFAAHELHARKSPAGAPSERVVSFRSQAVRGTVKLVVLLPRGYATSHLRYPVVYFLHGLPASGTSFRNVGFLRTPLASIARPAILVAPQGAHDDDSDPEYLDWGPGREWETAVSKELPAFVDSHFRTIRNRRGRALVGLSAGGYGAVILALHHLDDFGAVESWSGYFHPTNPAGTQPLDLGSPAKNAYASAHAFVSALRRDQQKRPTFFAFYVGSGDKRFRDDNLQLHAELKSAGVQHVFEVYPGAHGGAIWNRHAKQWLVLALAHLAAARGSDPSAPAGFRRVKVGPNGGAVWKGRIPNRQVRWDRRPSAIYLPPGYDPSTRYRVLYLLHGFPGAPSGFYDSVRFTQIADPLIADGVIKPFIAVMPVAGRTTNRADEEWTGAWEAYVVDDVVPWTNRRLPTTAGQSGRVIAGLSAGAYGAVDITLRHPGLFGSAESWSGYFKPFRDGSLTHAGKAELDAHDPTLLVRREAARLRAQHVAFFLSTGFNHGGVQRRWTFGFARELRQLGLRYELRAATHPERGRYYRTQLPAALEFAFGG
jgi:enterochelin esterase-like enzyme